MYLSTDNVLYFVIALGNKLIAFQKLIEDEMYCFSCLVLHLEVAHQMDDIL